MEALAPLRREALTALEGAAFPAARPRPGNTPRCSRSPTATWRAAPRARHRRTCRCWANTAWYWSTAAWTRTTPPCPRGSPWAARRAAWRA
ncbi:hypothetical protein HML84_19510 [Alcanivorax sp. IO_7]|nr:hypothetical protein HML84_19510 [Alcanivorax sp. IO_7]